MAALPNIDIEQTKQKLSPDEAAAELYKIVESHFDDLGLAEQEREARYASLRESLDAKDVALSKA